MSKCRYASKVSSSSSPSLPISLTNLPHLLRCAFPPFRQPRPRSSNTSCCWRSQCKCHGFRCTRCLPTSSFSKLVAAMEASVVIICARDKCHCIVTLFTKSFSARVFEGAHSSGPLLRNDKKKPNRTVIFIDFMVLLQQCYPHLAFDARSTIW